MIVVVHTFFVASAEEARSVDVDRLWRSLVEKAESPVSYVPSITGARVVERYDDGFLREIELRGRHRFRERVVLEPKQRVVFQQLDDPQISEITNEIRYTEQGEITYTITATLRPETVDRAGGLLVALDNGFFDAARGSVNTLRMTALNR
jgi:hypothetical protein